MSWRSSSSCLAQLEGEDSHWRGQAETLDRDEARWKELLENAAQRVQGATARHAEAAADRPATGAELLPGNGAFLRIDGAHITRLQAYWLDDAGTQSLVDLAQRTWLTPVRTGAETISRPVQPENREAAPVRTGASGATDIEFPLPRRAPTSAEAAAIRSRRAELPSLNATIVAVYGAKSSDTHRWVSDALVATETPAHGEATKIIRMGGAR